MGKKAICLFFAFLLSINSFGAVVSDNDGSAFITKDEFESLKRNFNDQITNYNESIDNKINGAIASYLMNVRLDRPVTYDTINRKWNEMVFISGSYANKYKIPDINYLVGLNGASQRPSGTSTPEDIRAFDSNFKISYKRPIIQTNRKNCFKVIEGTEGAPTKLYWRGIARGYREIINCSIQNSITGSNYSAFCWPDSDFEKRVMCNYPLKCKSPSYNVDYSSKVFDVSVMPQARQKPSGGWYDATSGVGNRWDKALTKFNIELDTIGGLQYDTEHIIGWSKDTTWELYCPDWNHTWQLSSNQTVTETSLYDAATKETSGWYEGLERTGDYSVKSHVGSMPFVFSNGTNKFYSVGLYATAVKNMDIYQMDDNLSYKSTGTFTVYNTTLEAGLPILAAQKDDEVTYTPTITEVQCYNESGNLVTNANELEIYFSYGLFYEKNSTSDPVEIEIGEQTAVKNNFDIIKNYI